MRVFDESRCQEETRVRAMRHARASIVSLYYSSRVPIGLKIAPTLTGSVSRSLASESVPFSAAPYG
jgi:hypothetical protein